MLRFRVAGHEVRNLLPIQVDEWRPPTAVYHLLRATQPSRHPHRDQRAIERRRAQRGSSRGRGCELRPKRPAWVTVGAATIEVPGNQGCIWRCNSRIGGGSSLIGVLLALISLAVSDLAPDAHVQLALHANEDDGRARLPWGHVRPIDPLASDPETGPEVGVSGMLDAPWKLKAMSAGGYLTLVGGLLIAPRRTEDRNLMALTGVVALHPTLIFVTGSGIEEPIVAGAFAIVAWGVLAFDGSRRPVAALAVVLGFAIATGVKIHPQALG